MDKKIKDLTVSEFSTLVKRIVRKELKEFDPDEGLEVKDDVKKLLRKSAKERKSGKLETIPFEEVFK
ncbi:MAG: hypothetical protein J0M37_00095 [Ignavibacteria bacterium]|nr:hypothetical protein [Ignavibacteria bacterium]